MILMVWFKVRSITNKKSGALVLACITAKIIPILDPIRREKESNLIQWTGGVPRLEVYTLAPQFFVFYSSK